MHRHIMTVLPHPDDESFSAGGILALQTRAGGQATVVCATRGELGRNMGRPAFATRESLPDLREKELREACRILGVQDVRLLGLRDKTLEFWDEGELAGIVRRVIEEGNPSLVITFYPGHGIHPDHNALGAATVRAVREIPGDRRPTLYCRAIGEKVEEIVGPPDEVVDVRSVVDVKIAALRAHRSQTESMLAKMEARVAEDPAFREHWERERSRESFWIIR